MTDAEIEEFKRALTLPFAEGQSQVRKAVYDNPELVALPECIAWAHEHFEEMKTQMRREGLLHD